MYLAFLQTLFPGYTLSNLESFPVFSKTDKDPSFCLLSKFPSLKKAKKLTASNRVWILPISTLSSYFLRRKLLCSLQPLYFISRKSDGSFILFDQRYLKLEKGIYRLPPLAIDLSTSLEKDVSLEKKEDTFFFPKRTSSFYFKGDTLNRLSIASYERALLERQKEKFKKTLHSFYLFIKRKLDN